MSPENPATARAAFSYPRARNASPVISSRSAYSLSSAATSSLARGMPPFCPAGSSDDIQPAVDGWYDHVLAPVTTQSQTALDTLTGTGACGSELKQVPVNSAGQPEHGRCGLGVRMPFLVISPFAKRNFVDNTLIDQSSVVKFIEYNWHLPAMGNGAVDATAGSILSMFDFSAWNPPLFLDPSTGQPEYRP
jgi:hypothetical protein